MRPTPSRARKGNRQRRLDRTLAIAKALGTRVIATSSSGAKLARARELGADATFDHNADDVVAGVPRRPYWAAYPERVYCFF